ncbi:hypothetical protein KFE98_08355 [bacterium SCSIO 12741]|nr:hypothetical protein KFE98_08355 [bacterium SCSIO 12741]
MEKRFDKLEELMKASTEDEKKVFLESEGLPENFFEIDEQVNQVMNEPLEFKPSEGVKSRLDNYFEIKHANSPRKQSAIPIPEFLNPMRLQSWKWFLTGVTACLFMVAIIRVDFGPQGEWENAPQLIADTAVENVVDSNQIFVSDSLGF